MLKTGSPGYLWLIHKWKTFGLMHCVTSKGPIHRCFSLLPEPFVSTQSREWGFTKTLSPFLNSGTGLLPLLYCCACSSWAFTIALHTLSLCIVRAERKLLDLGEREYRGLSPSLAPFGLYFLMPHRFLQECMHSAGFQWNGTRIQWNEPAFHWICDRRDLSL